MPVSDGFTEFVVDQLAGCGTITAKRMFGGVGIYAGELFFAILDADRLYLKVDDSNRGDFDAVGTGPFRPYGDDTEVMQYYEVPVGILEDADELVRWGHKALAVAAAARVRKKARARRAALKRPAKKRPAKKRPARKKSSPAKFLAKKSGPKRRIGKKR